jgi:hypothetical protein
MMIPIRPFAVALAILLCTNIVRAAGPPIDSSTGRVTVAHRTFKVSADQAEEMSLFDTLTLSAEQFNAIKLQNRDVSRRVPVYSRSTPYCTCGVNFYVIRTGPLEVAVLSGPRIQTPVELFLMFELEKSQGFSSTDNDGGSIRLRIRKDGSLYVDGVKITRADVAAFFGKDQKHADQKRANHIGISIEPMKFITKSQADHIYSKKSKSAAKEIESIAENGGWVVSFDDLLRD